jgi:1,4-alpha-glucan branching enzyme
MLLKGSWDVGGYWSEEWSSRPMQRMIDEYGCLTYTATVELADAELGRIFYWGTAFESEGREIWAIPTEQQALDSDRRHRQFTLAESGSQSEYYYLSHCRYLGATKVFHTSQESFLRLAVWSPNARAIDVVFGDQSNGYIDDQGGGMGQDPEWQPMPMTRGEGDIWIAETAHLFGEAEGQPYMYRIEKDDGSIAYRSDLYARSQIGRGAFDPEGQPYTGTPADLDGTRSCSLILDPDRVFSKFVQCGSSDAMFEIEQARESDHAFWADEFDPQRPIPRKLEELVIYELHVGGLGLHRQSSGNLEMAIEHLGYLEDLGVNAVEILPINEFEGRAAWGYGTSHFFAIEHSGGGSDQFKHFVRECHRRGIAVILDVVYNHYHHHAERAQWLYDTNAHERNLYYWYEGKPSDYGQYDDQMPPSRKGTGGYVDNESSGWAPRYSEQMVRQLFISSAIAMLTEYHVDGFRVDQTTAIRSYNRIHAHGQPLASANIWGGKFLREWTRTMRMIKPGLILIAEDHDNDPLISQDPDSGGLGFDATWYADFYHHLVGDTKAGDLRYAKLIHTAALGDHLPLAMDYFAGTLQYTTQHRTICYHASHDEVGNATSQHAGQIHRTGRTIAIAVNRAPLVGDVRKLAEARSRFAAGMALLAAGTPMFFMGEEVGFEKDYTHDNFENEREDFFALRGGTGQYLFRFYRDLIQLRLHHRVLAMGDLEILHTHNINRVIAFHRWLPDQPQILVMANLCPQPYDNAYVWHHASLPDGQWSEIFNSDAVIYGGDGISNGSRFVLSSGGSISAIIPASGFIVFLATSATSQSNGE